MKAEDLNPQEVFLNLHATLAHQPQLVLLCRTGTPLRTLLSLYPVEPETYLPYLRARFATRKQQKLDSMWVVGRAMSPYSQGLQALLESCTPEESRYYSDTDLGPKIVSLIEQYVDPKDPTNWNRSNLTFEVTDVLDLASRLHHFDMRRYLLLPHHERASL